MSTIAATAKAIFAGGCFWCMQPAFDALPGVEETTVGFTGGTVENPTYEQVTRGGTGHREAIMVRYDPAQVSYTQLLDVYWDNIDPFDAEGQFADKGEHYKTAIYFTDESQWSAAQASKDALAKRHPGQQVFTEILPAKPFYAAEDYHQKYYQKNEGHYTMYKYGSGRVARLKELKKETAP